MVFEWIVKRWSKLPELMVTVDNPAIIVPLGYAMLCGGNLPLITIDNFETAIAVRKCFPKALMVFGNFCHPCFPGSEVVESRLKHDLLVQNKVPLDAFLDVGPITTNTVTEAEGIKDALNTKGIDPKEIVLITGQTHARYAVLVWKETFPLAKIALAVTPYYGEYQLDQMIILQRRKYVVFLVRVVQYIIARCIGIGFFRKIQHPVS